MYDLIIDLATTAATQADRAVQFDEPVTCDQLQGLQAQLLAAAADVQTAPAKESHFELLDHGRQLIAHTMVRLDRRAMNARPAPDVGPVPALLPSAEISRRRALEQLREDPFRMLTDQELRLVSPLCHEVSRAGTSVPRDGEAR